MDRPLPLGLVAAALHLCAGWCILAHALDIPTRQFVEFTRGEVIEPKVSTIRTKPTSQKPPRDIEYYALPFCKPEEGITQFPPTVTPGNLLSDGPMQSTPYKFIFQVHEMTTSACAEGSAGSPPLTKAQAQEVQQAIQDGGHIHMTLDEMPLTTYDIDAGRPAIARNLGFDVGVQHGDDYLIFNHMVFHILIHRERPASHRTDNRSSDSEQQNTGAQGSWSTEEPKWTVVGFEALPCSIAREPGAHPKPIKCFPSRSLAKGDPGAQRVYEGAQIVYTYDVYWQETDIHWASRWDRYLLPQGGLVSTVGGLVWAAVLLMLLLSGLCAIVVTRDDARQDVVRCCCCIRRLFQGAHRDRLWQELSSRNTSPASQGNSREAEYTTLVSSAVDEPAAG